MSRLDELPPDQRAALSLLLQQHKTYAQVAAMLGIPERAVHDRAHAALAILSPRQAREVPLGRREEVADYLLGQQAGVAERLRTRTYLSSSEPARGWALSLAAELTQLGGSQLGDIPPAGASASPQSLSELRSAAAAAAGQATPVSSLAPDAAASSPPPASAPSRPSSSRVGGAVLLAVIIAAVVVAAVLIDGSGSHKKAGTGTSTTASSKAAGPTLDARLPIRSPNPASRSIGVVQILSEGSKRAFYVVAENMPATRHFFYALWLYNSSSSHEPLGRAPAVGATHRLEGGGLLPADAGSYSRVLLTRETSTRATHPGKVVLEGAFSLG